MTNKKIYFASDQHFGAPTPEASFPREQKFVAWLDEVKKDAEAIFLFGLNIKLLFQKDLLEF
jgi:UDP-2,3-diacylglucosamine hydrolase